MLFRSLGAFFRMFEMLVDQAVEDRGVTPGRAAQTGRIIHDDQAEKQRDAEQRRAESLFQPHRSGERGNRGGVGAGHAPGFDEAPKVPMAAGEEGLEPLECLNDKAGDECEPERFRGGVPP